jgi:hypothetical protein
MAMMTFPAKPPTFPEADDAAPYQTRQTMYPEEREREISELSMFDDDGKDEADPIPRQPVRRGIMLHPADRRSTMPEEDVPPTPPHRRKTESARSLTLNIDALKRLGLDDDDDDGLMGRKEHSISCRIVTSSTLSILTLEENEEFSEPSDSAPQRPTRRGTLDTSLPTDYAPNRPQRRGTWTMKGGAPKTSHSMTDAIPDRPSRSITLEDLNEDDY